MTAPGCDKVLLVQAELDGELDAAEAAALTAHRADCPVCQEAAAELTQARALIDAPALYHAMPDEVRARITAALADRRAAGLPHTAPSLPARGARSGRRQWWRQWWSPAANFGLGAACAAGLAFLLIVPREAGLTHEVIAGHIRALQPGHLEDVVSTDQHTVKPWFDGRIDFAPPVKDLAAERFPLKGGRLDYLAGRPVAALVYQHDKHLIDLYVWPSPGTEESPETVQRQGYNIVHWSGNGDEFLGRCRISKRRSCGNSPRSGDDRLDPSTAVRIECRTAVPMEIG